MLSTTTTKVRPPTNKTKNPQWIHKKGDGVLFVAYFPYWVQSTLFYLLIYSTSGTCLQYTSSFFRVEVFLATHSKVIALRSHKREDRIGTVSGSIIQANWTLRRRNSAVSEGTWLLFQVPRQQASPSATMVPIYEMTSKWPWRPQGTMSIQALSTKSFVLVQALEAVC